MNETKKNTEPRMKRVVAKDSWQLTIAAVRATHNAKLSNESK